jgi:Phytanoyl-CoA dioxygenase (PhyH)
MVAPNDPRQRHRAMSFRNPIPGVPLIESPFFDLVAEDSHFHGDLVRIASDLRRDGLAVLDFPDNQIEQRSERIKTALHDSYDWEQWRSAGFLQGQGLRVQDAWSTNDDVRAIALNTGVLEILSKLYGRRAIPFQTLNFPVGTQQPYHSDSVHFSSIPERYMCGVWVALEDIDEDNGPLVYFPGSHQWPIYSNEHIGKLIRKGDDSSQQAFQDLWEKLVKVHNLEPKRFLAKKGQAVIWLANLLHGGDKQNSAARTRWSQVTHYFFEDCAYYAPMASIPMIGPYGFRQIVDISTGERVKNTILGQAVPDRNSRVRSALRRLRRSLLPRRRDAKAATGKTT